MELERSLGKFQEQGLGVAAISYDSQAILHHFSERMGGFNYPLLSDEDSIIIRAFGIFNNNVPEDHEAYGMCLPGTYIVDENGIVRSKYFEEMHRQRFTADTLLIKEYGGGGGKRTEIRTDHLTLNVFPSQDTVRRGNIVSLVLELQLPPKTHVCLFPIPYGKSAASGSSPTCPGSTSVHRSRRIGPAAYRKSIAAEATWRKSRSIKSYSSAKVRSTRFTRKRSHREASSVS